MNSDHENNGLNRSAHDGLRRSLLWNVHYEIHAFRESSGPNPQVVHAVQFLNVSNLLSWAVQSWFLTAWNLGKWFIWIYELIYEPTFHLLFIANTLSNIGEKKKNHKLFWSPFLDVQSSNCFFFFDYLALITWLHFLNKNVYVNKEILLNLVFFI